MFLTCIFESGDTKCFKIIGFISFLANYLFIHLVTFFSWVKLQRLASSSANPFHFLSKHVARICFPCSFFMAAWLSSSPDCNKPLYVRPHQAKVKLLAVPWFSLQTLEKKGSVFLLIQVVGRIHFFVVVGLESTGP